MEQQQRKEHLHKLFILIHTVTTRLTIRNSIWIWKVDTILHWMHFKFENFSLRNSFSSSALMKHSMQCHLIDYFIEISYKIQRDLASFTLRNINQIISVKWNIKDSQKMPWMSKKCLKCCSSIELTQITTTQQNKIKVQFYLLKFHLTPSKKKNITKRT